MYWFVVISDTHHNSPTSSIRVMVRLGRGAGFMVEYIIEVTLVPNALWI